MENKDNLPFTKAQKMLCIFLAQRNVKRFLSKKSLISLLPEIFDFCGIFDFCCIEKI